MAQHQQISSLTTVFDDSRSQLPMQWREIVDGDFVTVVDHTGLNAKRTVDGVHPEGEYLWVRLEGGQGRRLFHFQDGVKVLAHHQLNSAGTAASGPAVRPASVTR